MRSSMMFVLDGYEIISQQALWNGCWKFFVRRAGFGDNAVGFFFPVAPPNSGDLEKLYQYFLPLKKIVSRHVISVREVERISNPVLLPWPHVSPWR